VFGFVQAPPGPEIGSALSSSLSSASTLQHRFSDLFSKLRSAPAAAVQDDPPQWTSPDTARPSAFVSATSPQLCPPSGAIIDFQLHPPPGAPLLATPSRLVARPGLVRPLLGDRGAQGGGAGGGGLTYLNDLASSATFRSHRGSQPLLVLPFTL